jgi:hypothetical protein
MSSLFFNLNHESGFHQDKNLFEHFSLISLSTIPAFEDLDYLVRSASDFSIVQDKWGSCEVRGHVSPTMHRFKSKPLRSRAATMGHIISTPLSHAFA